MNADTSRWKPGTVFNATYQLIRSDRTTISLELTSRGLVVRAPYAMSKQQIDQFVKSKEAWIARHQAKMEEQMRTRPAEARLSMDEIRDLADLALKVIPERVAYYAPLVGVTYGRIAIRNQRSRWGSCSSKGNLNFNCLLMLTPPEVLDSVVVHELCHRKEMNHSQAFYAEVLRVFPEYKKWYGWLKENGAALMRRMTG